MAEAILRPEIIDDCARVVRPGDFYNPAHAAIWEALCAMRVDRRPIDIVAVGSYLTDREELARVGGPGYLAKLVGEVPATVHPVPHAERVATLARRRRLISAMQARVAEGYGEVTPSWEAETSRELSEIAREAAPRGAVACAWRPLPLDLLQAAPPARRWLLRHPTRDGAECPFAEGDGMIPLGKAGILSSEGGVGKTMVLLELAIAVVTGRAWLGHFHPAWDARKGRVLLGLAEEDLEEVHRRLYTAAEALKLTAEERQRVAARIVVLPLAGRPVSIVAYGADGTTIVDTDELVTLRSRLAEDAGEHGWSLIVLDPLARWAGPDVEGDNTAATRFVQAVESLCEVSGRPTVLIAHHSSKASRREGKADARGVTAITDGFRWAATLRHDRGRVLFEQAKSNYSRPMPEALDLVRTKGGALRARNAREEADDANRREVTMVAREEAREKAVAASHAAAVKRLEVAFIQALRRVNIAGRVQIDSRASLMALVPGKSAIKTAALTSLVTDGLIEKTDRGYRVTEKTETRSEELPPDLFGEV